MSVTKTSINQKQIATETGVSQSTVSLVLSGRGIIAEETRQRVLATAGRLKYRPNLLVHGMQTGRTRMVGVMAPPFDSYWAKVLYGVHDELSSADYVPLMLWAPHDTGDRFAAGRNSDQNSGRNAFTEIDQIHRLLDRRIDGVILWPSFATLFGDNLQEFLSRNLPVVTIDHELPADFRAVAVGSDEVDGARLVARHLYQLGHRRVGHLAGRADSTWAVLRRTSFVEAFAALPGTECVTVEAAAGDPAFSIEQARRLIAVAPRLTAIYAATDLFAKLVYRAAAERALRVPNDLTVVGFADDDFAAEMSPPLTTIHQPGYEIGKTAASTLLRLIDNTRPKPSRQVLPVRLCVRGSTAPPRGNERPGDGIVSPLSLGFIPRSVAK